MVIIINIYYVYFHTLTPLLTLTSLLKLHNHLCYNPPIPNKHTNTYTPRELKILLIPKGGRKARFHLRFLLSFAFFTAVTMCMSAQPAKGFGSIIPFVLWGLKPCEREKIWLIVVCETKWDETKWKSVVCEMEICSLPENLPFHCIFHRSRV